MELLRSFGDGWAPFFVTDSLVQDQPDQSILSMGDGSDGLVVSQARDGAAIHNLEDASLALAAALAAGLSNRRMGRLPFGERWL